MALLRLFNPDNDMALAHGGVGYTAVPVARQLATDLQLLPCWLADAGDVVLCEQPQRYAEWLDRNGLAHVRLIGEQDLSRLADVEGIAPWGWSMALRYRLRRLGVLERLLPDARALSALRLLSHRRTTIALHRRIAEIAGMSFCAEPVELHSLDAVRRYAEQHPNCYVKWPWSGSGRGVMRVTDAHGRDFVQRVGGAIRRQGSVLCEQGYNRLLDFAIELYCEPPNLCRLLGYSMFENDFHLQYAYGTVEPADILRREVLSRCRQAAVAIECAVQAVAEIVSPHYCGPAGVDMLLYRDDHNGATCVNPCVELNLRTTMGHVCCALAERHGLRGTFRIAPDNDGRYAALLQQHDGTTVRLTP